MIIDFVTSLIYSVKKMLLNIAVSPINVLLFNVLLFYI